MYRAVEKAKTKEMYRAVEKPNKGMYRAIEKPNKEIPVYVVKS